MEFLQIGELKFYKKDDEGDFKVEYFDWYDDSILTDWLKEDDIRELINFLQKQIENR